MRVSGSPPPVQLRAPGPNPLISQPDGAGLVARAGAGLCHGMIAPVTLVLSFFNSEVHLYEAHHARSEYDLGFLLGVTLVIALLSLFARFRRSASISMVLPVLRAENEHTTFAHQLVTARVQQVLARI